jgi:hypothetical protein
LQGCYLITAPRHEREVGKNPLKHPYSARPDLEKGYSGKNNSTALKFYLEKSPSEHKNKGKRYVKLFFNRQQTTYAREA